MNSAPDPGSLQTETTTASPTRVSLGIDVSPTHLRGVLLVGNELIPVQTAAGHWEFPAVEDDGRASAMRDLWSRVAEMLQEGGLGSGDMESVVFCVDPDRLDEDMDQLCLLAETAALPMELIEAVERPLAVATVACRRNNRMSGPFAVLAVERDQFVLTHVNVDACKPKFLGSLAGAWPLDPSIPGADLDEELRRFVEPMVRPGAAPLVVHLSGDSPERAIPFVESLCGSQPFQIIEVADQLTGCNDEIQAARFAAAAGASLASQFHYRRDDEATDATPPNVYSTPPSDLGVASDGRLSQAQGVTSDAVSSPGILSPPVGERSTMLTSPDRPHFRRVYYNSVQIGRNEFRGAAPKAKLEKLAGLNLEFLFEENGIVLRVLKGNNVEIDGAPLDPGDEVQLPNSTVPLNISGIYLDLSVR